MATVLITGANRGLGLEFSKQYAEAGWQVIACCRQPARATALNALAEKFPTLQVEALDVAQFEQIDSLAQRLANTAIDIVINNAGIYEDKPSRDFGNLDYQAWAYTLLVNTQAPVKVTEALLNSLKLGNKKLIVTISSLMGSITDNTSGGSLFYRSSKAAINAAMKSLAITLRHQAIGVLTLHPGWVRTDMGGPNALISAEESVMKMREVIEKFNREQSGSFIKYDGTLLPW